MIEDMLKLTDRVELGWSWLLWEDQEWVVYRHGDCTHQPPVEYRGQSLEDALRALIFVKVEEAQE